MKLHPSHSEILAQIRRKAGQARQDTFLEGYLGNDHPKYAISAPEIRKIAKEWAAKNATTSADEWCEVVSSLIHGESFTEKVFGGILLGYAKPSQRQFDINIFDDWLEQLSGWAEVDSLCTGKFMLKEIPLQFSKWKPLLKAWASSDKIEKRRASLVCFCSPISHCDDDAIAGLALQNISKLKKEKGILITKAISWLLRSMIRHHRAKVEACLREHGPALPSIAIRETMVKLKTRTKGGSRRKTT